MTEYSTLIILGLIVFLAECSAFYFMHIDNQKHLEDYVPLWKYREFYNLTK